MLSGQQHANIITLFQFNSRMAIFKTRNGESGNGLGNRGMERGMEREKPESLKPGTRKAGIFKTRNEKSRNL